MKQAVMKKWVKALRSGKYKQGRNNLQGPRGFCCLGVLCEIAKEEGVGVRTYASGSLLGENIIDQPDVRDWSGMKDENGKLPRNAYVTYGKKGYLARALTELNDEAEYSFREIAKVIERHWRYL